MLRLIMLVLEWKATQNPVQEIALADITKGIEERKRLFSTRGDAVHLVPPARDYHLASMDAALSSLNTQSGHALPEQGRLHRSQNALNSAPSSHDYITGYLVSRSWYSV